MTNIIALGLNTPIRVVSKVAQRAREFWHAETSHDERDSIKDAEHSDATSTNNQMPHIPGYFEDDTEADEKILGGVTTPSPKAIPINMPGSRPSHHQPPASKPWPGKRQQGQLAMQTIRGDNVRSHGARPSQDDTSFSDNTDNKRRRTTHSSQTRRTILRQHSTVDLTDEARDNGLFSVGSREREIQEMTGSMAPRVSSPHRLSGRASSAHRSHRASRGHTSIAQDFGRATDFTSVDQRFQPRRRQHGDSNGNPFSTSSLRGPDRAAAVAPVATASGHKNTHHGRINGSQPNRRRVIDDAIHEDDDDGLEISSPVPLSENRTRELDAQFKAKAGPSQNCYRRANEKKRASMSSADELENGDSHFTVGRGNASNAAIKQRLDPHDAQRDRQRLRDADRAMGSGKAQRQTTVARSASRNDIQPSAFVKSSVAQPSDTRKVYNGQTSGWVIPRLASNLVPLIRRNIKLQLRNGMCTITHHRLTEEAIHLKKITFGRCCSKYVVLEGDGATWAAIEFETVQDRLGFTAQLKNGNRHVRTEDPLDSGIMRGIFENMLLAHQSETTSEISAKEIKPNDPETDRIQHRVTMFDAALAEAEATRTRRTDGARPSKLISDLTTTENSRVDMAPPNSTGFKEPRRLRNGRSGEDRRETFALGDDGKVSATQELVRRRSGRSGATRIRSQFFGEDPEDVQVAPVVPQSERFSVKEGLGDPWQFSLTYPLIGRDRATVEWSDLERLDDGEFLNDNLIEFYLRWARQQQIDKGTYKDGQVHFFNTFFYEKLSGSRPINYKAVESWTRKVDIFDINYVVVPVNENTHWYVCIICNLRELKRAGEVIELEDDNEAGAAGKEAASGADDFAAQLEDAAFGGSITTPKTSSSGPISADAGSLDVADAPTPASPVTTSKTLDDQRATFSVDADASQDSIVRSDGILKNAKPSTPKSGRSKRRRSGPTPRKYDPNVPIIITLDSLGLTHAKTTSNLKEYIIAEGAAKHGLDLQKEAIKGTNATRAIPQQQNFCDCGVYLLAYIEKFLEGPQRFVTKILTNEMDEGDDWPNLDPKQLRADVRSVIQTTYEEQLPERIAMKKKKKPKPAEPLDAGHPPIQRQVLPAKIQSTAQGNMSGDGEDPTVFETVRLTDTDDRVDPPADYTAHDDSAVPRTADNAAIATHEEPAEDMLLDGEFVAGNYLATHRVEDKDMLLGHPDSHTEVVVIPSPSTEKRHSKKRSRDTVEIDEIPDSQEKEERQSKSPRKQAQTSHHDAIADLEAITFPLGPTPPSKPLAKLTKAKFVSPRR